jgi:hypothetical protein
MCAWKQQMNTDATTRHPQAVLLQFTGTPYSPCAQVGAWGSPEFLAHLRQVAVQTAQLFIGHGASRVYLVGAPVSVDSTPSSPDAKVSDVYRSVARLLGHRVVFVDAGRSVETAVGGFTWTRPCLVSEVKASPSLCTGGIKDHVRVNVVRQPDGVHFCPTPWPSDIFPPQGCPTYASGAYRYGVAMVAPLIHDYSLGSPPSLREVSPSGGS